MYGYDSKVKVTVKVIKIEHGTAPVTNGVGCVGSSPFVFYPQHGASLNREGGTQIEPGGNDIVIGISVNIEKPGTVVAVDTQILVDGVLFPV